MGMFDYFNIGVKQLPNVSEKEKEWLQKEDWQTKDLENQLYHYYVDDDGQLWVETYIYEQNSKYDPNHIPTDRLEALKQILNSTKAVPQKPRKVEYTGSIRFYTDTDENPGIWYEFVALFSEGKMLNIVRVYES